MIVYVVCACMTYIRTQVYLHSNVQIMDSIGRLLFTLLDYGLEEDEEQCISSSLENLIGWLTEEESECDSLDSSTTDEFGDLSTESDSTSTQNSDSPPSSVLHDTDLPQLLSYVLKVYDIIKLPVTHTLKCTMICTMIALEVEGHMYYNTRDLQLLE